ncbi:DUF4275 family protein [Paenibacillus harenae]|uniref:DUF4275 family protein n=1 Tax=Paenibacillus harenae TaxID=306543 RepID=UPI0027940C4B|nr:DUF4275 family protein [Paenibacillus harenae]MDQ0060115.1 hypothetical protein [Paenibacillus harenae]
MFPKKRHIHIDGWGWEEDNDHAQVSVIVTFPDASRWLCHFYTLKCIQSIREDMLRTGNRIFMFAANPLVIVDTISRKHIEEVVDESIGDGTFDLLFEYFGAVSEHDREQLPEGFLPSDAKIESIEIPRRSVADVQRMMQQSSEAVRQTAKQWIFGDPNAMVETLMIGYMFRLEERGIAATLERDKGQELRDRWEWLFARGLDKEFKRDIYLEQYLWHLFSYERLSFLEKEEAEEAFRSQEKQECYLFYQNRDHALYISDASLLTADDLRTEQDIYVVDRDFRWTYVQTHESDFRPYFYQR